jgi:hypothetical protein
MRIMRFHHENRRISLLYLGLPLFLRLGRLSHAAHEIRWSHDANAFIVRGSNEDGARNVKS